MLSSVLHSPTAIQISINTAEDRIQDTEMNIVESDVPLSGKSVCEGRGTAQRADFGAAERTDSHQCWFYRSSDSVKVASSSKKQAPQLSLRAAKPAKCHDRKTNIGS
jgi:hypothetical protein